jgi:hypothetical protein
VEKGFLSLSNWLHVVRKLVVLQTPADQLLVE